MERCCPIRAGRTQPLKVVLLTREYPPHVYGGAGVHVEHLARELSRTVEVEVRRFGPPDQDLPGVGRLSVRGFQPWTLLHDDDRSGGALPVMSVDLVMAAARLEGASLVHSHTWYANLAGHVASLLHRVPHVVTTHSLEPLRPWKAEQLGPGGYALSCFCERTGIEGAHALIAVSAAMREDVLRVYPDVDPRKVEVIHNGIDTDAYRPVTERDALKRFGIDAETPYVLFLGRITRQKGLGHLLDAASRIHAAAQLVLCAGAPDTAQVGADVARKVREVQERRGRVVWIDRMVPRSEAVELLSHAAVFVCPSTYEPLGIVNLEAMACEIPVVATETGGIPEVVEDGVTGLLVPFEPEEAGGPADPAKFAELIAERVNELLEDPRRAKEMGRAGRRRVIERFTWSRAADRTVELYRRLAG